MNRALLQQARDALMDITRHFTMTPSTIRDSEVRGNAHKAIAALDAELAKPEPEPVAWRLWCPDETNEYRYSEDGDGEPLYLAPPSESEAVKLLREIRAIPDGSMWDDKIDAVLKGKP